MNVQAVRGVSFTVEGGERVAFIGPNGAGKSTSLKMLTGILRPSGGAVSVLGMVPCEQRRELALHIGALFGQRSMLWQELTPRTSFRMLAAIYGMDSRAESNRIGELGALLDAAQLFDQPLRTLSLGQRMRCELAACLLHSPRVVFLDEPTIGLDLVAKQRLRELLVRLNEEDGTTVFLTSHDVADIEHVAQRALVINHGVIIHDGDVAAMRRGVLRTRTVQAALTREIAAPQMAGVIVHEHSLSSITLEVQTDVVTVRAVLDALLADDSVSEVSVVDPPLESVIAAIYAEGSGGS